MYKLMLTHSERQAIDWVGNRYGHGDDLFNILMGCEWKENDGDDEEVEWDTDYDITFEIPENLAWEIREIAESGEYMWDCFSSKLSEKMTDFCLEII